MSSNNSSVEKVNRVQAFPTQDINGATLGEDYVSLKAYEHVGVVINSGNVAGNITVTLKQATAVAGTAEKALAFDSYWKDGVKTAVTSDTFDILAASDDNTVIVIPIDASELDVDNGFDCLRVDLTDPSAAALVGCIYEMCGGRYGALISPIVD
jgi:hypothetical protein